jgi:hypothetical protein
MALFLFIVNGFQAQYNMHIETKRQRRTGGKREKSQIFPAQDLRAAQT